MSGYFKSEEHINNVKKASILGIQKIKELTQEKIDEYNLNPNKCTNCNCDLNYEKRNNKFCSSSCAAIYNNKKRGSRTEETKNKIRKSINEYNKNNKKERYDIIHESDIYCQECGKKLDIIQKIRKNIFCSSECARIGRSKNENMKLKCKENAIERIKNGTHNGWNSRNIISYPEQFFIKVLNKNNIKYEFNYKVKHSDLKNFDGKSYYFLDFL